MKSTRRDFLKITGSVTTLCFLKTLGFDLGDLEAQAKEEAVTYGQEVFTLCPYCSVGCGVIIHTQGHKILLVEGDPHHPINKGGLCSRGAALLQISGQNPERLTHPLYRAPKSNAWQKVSWAFALDRLAENIYYTRERTFIEKNKHDQLVNRTEGMASVGGAGFFNEEGYAYQKFLRALGLVFIEHQARFNSDPTLTALRESFGWGAMTNHFIDCQNADVILMLGSDLAETHPVAFRWILEAKKRGATLIHIDPRFTRTSAKANLYAPIRAGTDLAFLGGLINYIIEYNLYCEKMLLAHTNASFLLKPEIRLPDDLDGVFSGYNPETRSYDKSTWAFQKDSQGNILQDPTLQHQYCVFTLLRKHFYRYSIEIVSRITGIPTELLGKTYQTFTSTKGLKGAGTIITSAGWTHHTVSNQILRAMAIIQLLLGNLGVAGGGINTIRCEANAQGAADQGLLYDYLPGYLKIPRASYPTLSSYLKILSTDLLDSTINKGGMLSSQASMVSLLKAFFGEAAQSANDFGYHWLPKIDDHQDCSWLMLFESIHHGQKSGLLVWEQNPACSGANATKVRKSLATLDWLMCVHLFDNETASFWRGPQMEASEVNTEVFLLPAAASFEKEGSFTNSGRWMQWSHQAVDPPAEAKSTGEILTELVIRLKNLYQAKGGRNYEAMQNLSWNFTNPQALAHLRLFDPHLVAKEINGCFLQNRTIGEISFPSGTQIPHQDYLQPDGSTSCGNWMYCSSYTEEGNMAERRDSKDPTGLGLHPGWAWSWPNNCRILYHKISADEKGKPWQEGQTILQFCGHEKAGEYLKKKMSSHKEHTGPPCAFPLLPNRAARLFCPDMEDGPFPEHYEPFECPIERNLLSSQRLNPTFKLLGDKNQQEGEEHFMICDPKYPFVCTTFQLSEHWQTGLRTRRQPWLLELQPQVFIEICSELAENKGIRNGEVCFIKSARGNLEAVALVTERVQPLIVNNQKIFQIGLPWHYGWMVPPKGGDTANILTPSIGDANTMIPETTAFLVDIVKISPGKK